MIELPMFRVHAFEKFLQLVATVRNRTFLLRASKFINSFVAQVFAATNEAQKNFDTVLAKDFANVAEGASICRQPDQWTA